MGIRPDDCRRGRPCPLFDGGVQPFFGGELRGGFSRIAEQACRRDFSGGSLEVRAGEFPDYPPRLAGNGRDGRDRAIVRDVPFVANRLYGEGSRVCGKTRADRAGRAADAANLRLRHGALCPSDSAGRYRRRGGDEPFRFLLLLQASEGDDLFAVRHSIPIEYGLRAVGPFAEVRVGDMLSCGV